MDSNREETTGSSELLRLNEAARCVGGLIMGNGYRNGIAEGNVGIRKVSSHVPVVVWN